MREVLHRKTLLLAVQLTDEELRTRGAQLADAQLQHDSMLEAHKTKRAKLRDEKKAAENELSRLAKVVAERAEERDVQVEVRSGPKKGYDDVVRLDTKEVVESRPMSEEEAQGDFSLEDFEPQGEA